MSRVFIIYIFILFFIKQIQLRLYSLFVNLNRSQLMVLNVKKFNDNIPLIYLVPVNWTLFYEIFFVEILIFFFLSFLFYTFFIFCLFSYIPTASTINKCPERQDMLNTLDP